MSKHAQHLHALLFALGRPLARAEVQKQLGVSPEEIEAAVAELQQQEQGVSVVDDGTMLELRVAADAASLVERIRKEEYAREVGRAGQEALACILYRGPLTRAEIDFVRGVNSTQTLRTLTMRGLVRKVQNPRDERSFLYEPTTELLATLGVARVKDLPDYEQVRGTLQKLEAGYKEKQQHNHAV